MNKLNLATALSIGLLLCFSVNAQISIGGIPKSFALGLDNSNIQTVSTENINLAALLEEDSIRAASNLPFRFAVPFPVSYSFNDIGTWMTLPNGDRLWRLRINCPQAESINLLYDNFYLPPGSLYYIYSADGTEVLGAFSDHNNRASRKFATALVHSSSIILEYYEPLEVAGQGIISVGQIGHGYRSFFEAEDGSEGLNDAGACQVNINCSPEGDNWQVEKKSVARMILNGSQLCTGTLINNIRGDCTPYFLSASHCIDGTYDAVTNPDLSGLVFYWNYERSTCANSGDVPNETTSGATLLANPDVFSDQDASDFALFELTEDPSSVYDVYFAGFDASGSPGTSGVGIHHPALDAKKIATHSITPTSVVNDNYWRIYWDATPNGHSVTEGGSSGSGLFNSDGRLIGQLFGGFLGGQPNCSDPANDEGDYGKLSRSWNNQGATDSRRRLRDWLDPDNTGTTIVDGLDCSASPDFVLTAIPDSTNSCGANSSTFTIDVSKVGSFNEPVTLSAIGVPAGASATFSANPVTPDGTSTLIIDNLNNVTDGTYTFNVQGNASVGTKSITLTLFDIAPNAATLISPNNNQSDVSTLVSLLWAAEEGAESYDVEVATDANFSNVVASATVLTTSWMVDPALAASTQHFWRVRHKRNCGNDPWSAVFSFTTNTLVNECIILESTDVPVGLFNKTTSSSTITFAQTGIITDVNVFMRGEHTRARDLIFELQSPSGTKIQLIDIDDSPCLGSIDDFEFGFDDASILTIVDDMSCPTTDGRYYLPQEALNIFNGEDLNGVWTLLVTDDRNQQQGDLLGWNLEICADISTGSGGGDTCDGEDLVLNDQPIATDTYRANNSIQSAGTVQTAANETTVFAAGNFVQLNPGFTVAAGSNFTVQIQSCNNSAASEETIEVRTLPAIATVSQLLVAPNPTSDQTLLRVIAKQEANLTLSVYDMTGKLVQQIAQIGRLEAGEHQYVFDASNLPEGIYVVAMRLGTETKIQKLSVIR